MRIAQILACDYLFHFEENTARHPTEVRQHWLTLSRLIPTHNEEIPISRNFFYSDDAASLSNSNIGTHAAIFRALHSPESISPIDVTNAPPNHRCRFLSCKCRCIPLNGKCTQMNKTGSDYTSKNETKS